MATNTGLSIFRLLGLWRHRDFALFAGGNGLSLIGTWAQRLTVGWLTWELTGSGFWLGVVVFADLFPTVVIGPLAGAMADRMNKLRLLMVFQALGMVAAFLMALVVWWDVATIGIIVLLTLALGIVDALIHPARLSIIHALVPRDQIGSAVALNSILFNLARFIGPAVAGVVIATYGAGPAILVNTLSFALFFVALMFVRTVLPPSPSGSRGILSDTRDGLRYVVRHATIGPIIGLVAVTGLLARPVIELLPGFAGAVYEVGAGGLAMMTSSVAAGALVASGILGSLPSSSSYARIAVIGGCGMAVMGILVTLTSSLWIALPLLVVLGVFNVSTFIAAQTEIQMSCEPQMRGRALALYGMVFRGAPVAGALAIGTLSEWFGFRIPVAASCMIALALIAWLWKSLASGAPASSHELQDASHLSTKGKGNDGRS